MDVDKELCPIILRYKTWGEKGLLEKRKKRKRELSGFNEKEMIVLRNEWIETYGGADVEPSSLLQ